MPRDSTVIRSDKPTERALGKAYVMGFEAYVDGNWENPWSRKHVPESRVSKMDDLSWQFSQGYAAAEKDARLEMKHNRSLRFPGC